LTSNQGFLYLSEVVEAFFKSSRNDIGRRKVKIEKFDDNDFGFWEM